MANPTLIAKPSVAPGKEQVMRIRYNAAGQRVGVTETGWPPAIGTGQAATPITRTTTYGYRSINGRSLLTQIDGPLANGKNASPQDSDITQIEYDRRGNYVTRITAPGMQTTTVAAVDALGRPSTVVGPDGVESRMEYDRDGHVARLVRAGLAQSYTYAALGGMESMSLATGERIGFTYAANGQLTGVADTQKNRIQLQWNTEDELQSRILLNPDGPVAQESELTRFVPEAGLGRGRPSVNIEQLARQAGIGPTGTDPEPLARVLRAHGVGSAKAYHSLTFEHVVAATQRGHSMITQMKLSGSHYYVVVDGVTRRPGLSSELLVAIRDPWKVTEYFLTKTEFMKRFNGWGILTNP